MGMEGEGKEREGINCLLYRDSFSNETDVWINRMLDG